MLNHWTIVPAVVLGFLIVTLVLGLRAGKGRIHTTADHVVGGRSLGFLLVFFVSIGEIYSSVAFLGQPGWAYEHGVSIFSNVGVYLSLIAFWLGPKIWAAGKQSSYLTQAQFLGDRFQSPLLRNVAAIVGITALVPYICVQIMGGGYVFHVTTDGRIPFWLGALMAFSVVAVYVYSGGLRAIGWVAVMKGIFMAVVGLYIVGHVVTHYFGSISAMFHQIAERSPAHLMFPGPKGFVNYQFQTTSLINSLVAFYMWPHLFANFFSAREPKIIRRQAIFVPIYNLIALSFTLVGFAGVLVVNNIKPDTVMVEMIKRVAPLWLVALFCAGALSASMVTGAACALAAAATVGNDLVQPRVGLTDARLKRLIQTLVFVVIGVGYGLALLQPALIVYIILMAYAVTAQLFPGVVASFYSRHITAQGVTAGLIAGFITALVFIFRWVEPPGNMHAGFLGLCVNIPVMLAYSYATSTAAKPVAAETHT
jgi:SSS family solute:Na+ symporter